MRRGLLAVVAVLAPAALGVASAGGQAGHDGHGAAADHVSIRVASFSPAHTEAIAGDTVMWSNDSIRVHTVTAVDGSWSSARLARDDTFSRRFDAPGSVAYYCTIHPAMRGEVDVHRLLLARPVEPSAPGRRYVLSGRAALPAGTAVSIEADAGAGFQPVAAATVDERGAFAAELVPGGTASYRAVAGTEASPPVQLVVLDRTVSASARTHGRAVAVGAEVSPASPGAMVVLQLRLRHRFGWWPVARRRVDHHSRAHFRLRLRHRVRARVLLTLSDGATALASSRTLRVGPHH